MEYTYTARTRAGVMQKDSMTAFNERAVADFLHGQGLIPTSIRQQRKEQMLKIFSEQMHAIKLIDKITFIKNLSVMMKAGLPVSRSLRILSTQTTNPRLNKIITQIGNQVESGTTLADAIGHFPKVFSEIFISMVRVGEASGTLEASLDYLADQTQRDYDLISKARGALTYPIVVLLALGLVGFLMFTFVLPKLTATFIEFDVKLPLMTRMVISLVDIFAKYGIFIFVGWVGLIAGFVYWRRTASGKTVIHKLIFYLPLISGIVIKINLARFVRVFASLIKSGMPIVDALDVSSHVVGNIYYQRTISDAASKVKIGSPLTTAFRKEPKLFPTLVIEMMEVGEESGTIETVLMEVANFYESDVEQTMKNLSSILEPILMMVIGAVVGFLAVALITPIYSITQSIS